MILTTQILEDGKSINGGWSYAQLKALGTSMKRNKGWKRKIIGTDIPKAKIDKFLSLKDAHLKKDRKDTMAYTYMTKAVDCPVCESSVILDSDEDYNLTTKYCKKCKTIYTIQEA